MAKGLNMATPAIALLATLAVAGFQHRDQLGKMLGEVLGDRNSGDGTRQPGNSFGTGFGKSGDLGGLLGSLGGMFGGGSGGGMLMDGLDGLLDRFRQNGAQDEAESWVTTGPNRTVEPERIEAALGPDVIEQLRSTTGLSREELLKRLSTNLPQTVDALTPEGRVPSHEEAARFI